MRAYSSRYVYIRRRDDDDGSWCSVTIKSLNQRGGQDAVVIMSSTIRRVFDVLMRWICPRRQQRRRRRFGQLTNKQRRPTAADSVSHWPSGNDPPQRVNRHTHTQPAGQRAEQLLTTWTNRLPPLTSCLWYRPFARDHASPNNLEPPMCTYLCRTDLPTVSRSLRLFWPPRAVLFSSPATHHELHKVTVIWTWQKSVGVLSILCASGWRRGLVLGQVVAKCSLRAITTTTTSRQNLLWSMFRLKWQQYLLSTSLSVIIRKFALLGSRFSAANSVPEMTSSVRK